MPQSWFSQNNSSAVAEGCFCQLSSSHKPTARSVPHILGILTVSVRRSELFLSAGSFHRVADLSFASYLWRYIRLLTSPRLSQRVVTSCSPNEHALFTRAVHTHSHHSSFLRSHLGTTTQPADSGRRTTASVCRVVPAWLPRCVTSSALCDRASLSTPSLGP